MRLSPVVVYARGIRAAARGGPVDCRVRRADGTAAPLDLHRYLAGTDVADDTVLQRCAGPTLDVGCGPGRFTAALADRGTAALGTDVCPEAVRQCRARGGSAVVGDVFDALPAEGRWHALLLTDGNIGIGGAPHRLLARARDLVRPDGRVVCEADPPGVPLTPVRIRLELGDPGRDGQVSQWFDWAHVGVDALVRLAPRCGLRTVETWTEDGRWFAVFSPC